MSDQPISLSRADRRKFEKAMRRAPRASRQKPSRADLPLRLIPWNIHGAWAPLDRILAKLELDDEITQQDIDDVRASSDVLRKLAGSLTLREARAYLDEACIKIEVEKAGLTESAA